MERNDMTAAKLQMFTDMSSHSR